MSFHSGRLAHLFFLATPVLALAIVPTAEGQQTGRIRRNAGAMQRGGGNRSGMANQGNAMIARSLHSTLQVLAQADHDYQGHRELAMRHVHTAIRHLVPNAAGRGQQNQAGSSVPNGGGGVGAGNGGAAGGTGNGGAGTGGTGGGSGGTVTGGIGKKRMPQATSDQHLQQALQSLTAIHAQIMSGGTTPNHARAATAVQNAIRELNIALSLR
jgi:hypothetical protein